MLLHLFLLLVLSFASSHKVVCLYPSAPSLGGPYTEDLCQSKAALANRGSLSHHQGRSSQSHGQHERCIAG